MIPKTLHYCWFGGKPLPANQQKYIDGWLRLMPDYKIRRWSESDIDINSVPLVKQAYESGTFAFVADYVRLYALLTEGGIYMDTDVKVKKTFDPYLDYSMFTSYEFHPGYKEYAKMLTMIDGNGRRIAEKDVKIPGAGLMSAIIGAEKGSPFIKDCMSIYHSMGYAELRQRNYTIPSTLAITAEKYGFRYANEFQLLDGNMAVFPSNIFADYRTADKKSVAVHWPTGSWGKRKGVSGRIKSFLYRVRPIRRVYMTVRNIFEKRPLHY